MRELLEQKDSQLQALQQDHEELKEKYEELLSSSRRQSMVFERQDSSSTQASCSESHHPGHKPIPGDGG